MDISKLIPYICNLSFQRGLFFDRMKIVKVLSGNKLFHYCHNSQKNFQKSALWQNGNVLTLNSLAVSTD